MSSVWALRPLASQPSPAPATLRGTTDSGLVARLRRAGVVIFGKTGLNLASEPAIGPRTLRQACHGEEVIVRRWSTREFDRR